MLYMWFLAREFGIVCTASVSLTIPISGIIPRCTPIQLSSTNGNGYGVMLLLTVSMLKGIVAVSSIDIG